MIVKKKIATFPFFRSIEAHMVQRFIFNYRISPDELKKRLPAPWLEPQVVNGSSIVSFCVLWLNQLTLSPIPPIIPFSTISCAYRIGVIDASEPVPTPAVYVIDRWADLPLISILGPIILHDTIPTIKAAIGHNNSNGTRLQMSYTDGSALFSAAVEPRVDGLGSSVFPTVAAFGEFIKNGVSSYGPSLEPGRLTKVDLHKEEVSYQPLNAVVDFNELQEESWSDAGLQLDSAVRAQTGARYVWTYQGLWTA